MCGISEDMGQTQTALQYIIYSRHIHATDRWCLRTTALSQRTQSSRGLLGHTRAQVSVKVCNTGELRRTHRAEMRLRNSRFIATMSSHPGDIARFRELDHLAVNLDEMVGRLARVGLGGFRHGHEVRCTSSATSR